MPRIMEKVVWVINYEEDTMYPNDGEEIIKFWWDDMRAREVQQLIEESYERGYRKGYSDCEKYIEEVQNKINGEENE